MWGYIKLYLLMAPVFFALDFIWIWFGANPMYRANIPHLLSEKPNMGVALVFYLIYLACAIPLVVMPAVRSGDVWTAVWMGALLGLAAYGTYDLTNWSIMKDWAWYVSVSDWAWGTFLTSVTATAGFYIARWLGLGV